MASTRNSSPPAELAERVAACLARHVRRGERLVAALSGGIDSVALLHLLHDLSRHHGFRLSAIHVNHGLSPHADDWQAFCMGLCQSLGIPLEVSRVEVRDAAAGLEAAARQARYAAYESVDAEWLVLAHQRDDQAETLLFNLLRIFPAARSEELVRRAVASLRPGGLAVVVDHQPRPGASRFQRAVAGVIALELFNATPGRMHDPGLVARWLTAAGCSPKATSHLRRSPGSYLLTARKKAV